MARRSRPSASPLARWLFTILALFLFVGVLTWTIGEVAVSGYDDRVFPGVFTAGIDLGGNTPEEARARLQQAVDNWNARGLVIEAEGKAMTLTTTVSAIGDLDLTYELMEFDVADTVRLAMAIGHGRDRFTNVLAGFRGLLRSATIPPTLFIDRAAIEKILRENFSQLERPARNARVVLSNDGQALTVTPSETGMTFFYQRAVDDVVAAFRAFRHPPVALALERDEPEVRTDDAMASLPAVERLFLTLPRSVELRAQEGELLATLPLERDLVAGWLELRRDNSGVVTLTLGSGLETWLDERLSGFESLPVEARFVLKDGRVSEFQQSRDGTVLKRAVAAAALREALLSANALEPIVLSLERVSPSVTTSEANPLGIRELIGFGTSNFKGSPKNRRHNIATGVAKLNGIIIPPGEEFSLVEALGKIEKETGYLPELVIKGDRTIPEYGGGLCQIGTTVFRAAMSAGFPILERKNHSYRVRYYEPAGTDATIYPPKPDFRFQNDTPAAVVLITKIIGDELRFEFWGTSDGRKAERTNSKISNIVRPPPTKLIETTDLAPGKKKCTEIAHDGADTVFTYTVTMPDGEKREQVFKSHYRPWQAVCLIGVKPEEKEKGPGSEEELALPTSDAPAVELPPAPGLPRTQ